MKKLRRIVVFLILILIIVLVASIVGLSKLKKQQPSKKEMLDYIHDDVSWEDGTPYPNDSYKIMNSYTGKLTLETMGKSMYYVATNVFPEYHKKLRNASEAKIKKYYEKNKEDILMDVGIDNSDSFYSLISYMQENLNIRKLEFDKFRTDMTSAIADDEFGIIHTSTLLCITYKDCEEVKFYVSINNEKQENRCPLTYMGY